MWQHIEEPRVWNQTRPMCPGNDIKGEKQSESKCASSVSCYSEDCYVTGSEWGRMQHRRLPAEWCQMRCSFIHPPHPPQLPYPPPQQPPPPILVAASQGWVWMNWSSRAFGRCFSLSRCPSPPLRKIQFSVLSCHPPTPSQSYIWVFEYFSSASRILLFSRISLFPSVISLAVEEESIFRRYWSQLWMSAYIRVCSFSLRLPPLPVLVGFGDLYNATRFGASLLCSVPTSVISIDVSCHQWLSTKEVLYSTRLLSYINLLRDLLEVT